MIGKIGLTIGIAFNVAILALSHGHPSYGYEVRGNLWEPGKQILQGGSPYDPATPKRALAEGTDCCIQALYPAPTHVLFAPLSWLPFDAAVVLFTLLATACLIVALWLLGLRSAAAFGIVLLLPPVWTGTQVGSITPFLVLGCALAWRWRDRPYLGGIAVAATVSAVAAVVMLAAGWAVIGFQNLLDYPQLLMNVSKLEVGHSISLARFGGEWLAVAVFVALLVVGRRSYSVMIVASPVLLPIVLLHSLQVLFVPAVLALPNPAETLGRLRRLRRTGSRAPAVPNTR